LIPEAYLGVDGCSGAARNFSRGIFKLKSFWVKGWDKYPNPSFSYAPGSLLLCFLKQKIPINIVGLKDC